MTALGLSEISQALNGGGYKQLETNTTKALAARLLVTPMPQDDMLKGLGVAGFAYVDKDDDNSMTRFGGMLKFSYQVVNLVGEFGVSQDGADEINGMGFAVATEVKAPVKEGPMENLALIGRLDRWDKNTDKDDDEVLRVIAGVSYEIAKGVKAIANLHHVGNKGKDESEQAIVTQAYIKF